MEASAAGWPTQVSFERQMDSLQLITARGFKPRLIQSLLLHPTSRTVRHTAGIEENTGDGDNNISKDGLVWRPTITEVEDPTTLPTGSTRPERAAYSAKVRVCNAPRDVAWNFWHERKSWRRNCQLIECSDGGGDQGAEEA